MIENNCISDDKAFLEFVLQILSSEEYRSNEGSYTLNEAYIPEDIQIEFHQNDNEYPGHDPHHDKDDKVQHNRSCLHGYGKDEVNADRAYERDRNKRHDLRKPQGTENKADEKGHRAGQYYSRNGPVSLDKLIESYLGDNDPHKAEETEKQVGCISVYQIHYEEYDRYQNNYRKLQPEEF